MTLAFVERRLQRLHQQSRIAAGSLIVSVFGDAVLPRGGGIWLGSLIGLMQQLGVNERLVRTAVFRLVKEDWLYTQTQGRRANYHLTAVGQRRFDEAARHIYAAHAPVWDGHWRMLVPAGELDARHRESLRRALHWQGFGEVNSGTFLHPSADLAETLDALAADGLGAVLPQLMPLLASQPALQPAASHATLVGRAWNLEQLAQGYAQFMADYRPLRKELDSVQDTTIAPRSAFLARSLMIHDFRRLLLQDPELPADLLPRNWPGEQARTLCAGIYGLLLQPSEHYLDENFALAGGHASDPTGLLAQRFRAD